jgi:hypothetical protein
MTMLSLIYSQTCEQDFYPPPEMKYAETGTWDELTVMSWRYALTFVKTS